MCDLFGGPTSGEENAQAQESQLSKSLMANYQQQYGQQQQVLSQLQSQIGRIQSGNTGPGYGGAENAALISGIQNQGAAATRNATQAALNRMSGQQFGGATDTSGLARTSAIRGQIAGQIGAVGATNTANALNQEQAANYAQGRTNAIQTASALQTMQGDFNPTAYASGASSTEQASFGQAHEINVEEQQKAQAIAKFIQQGVMTAATAGMGGIGALGAGESFGEGASDFMGGAMNALSGSNAFPINGPSQGGGGNGGGGGIGGSLEDAGF